jgi:hypothetical protein
MSMLFVLNAVNINYLKPTVSQYIVLNNYLKGYMIYPLGV